MGQFLATQFDAGIAIRPTTDPLGFEYGEGVRGPVPEFRSLESIRPSLRNPACTGPDPVYAIAMDVCQSADWEELRRRMLLMGVVTYAAGRLGNEPVRSQGHVHAVSRHSGWSPPELYEIWSGEAIIYMQEFAADDPGRCFAISARTGDHVLVPPGWAHATISADARQPLTFGALCDREYRFVYDELRKRQGLAWYPLLDQSGEVRWEQNPRYRRRELEIRPPKTYGQFGVRREVPLYRQVTIDFERFQWVSQPGRMQQIWNDFEP